MRLRHILGLLLGLALLLPAALARGEDEGASPGYSADTLTFERWCLEIEQYEAERCARRDPADLAAYGRSLDRLQAIEVEHNIKVRKDREFRKTFDAHTTLDRNRRFDF